MGAFRFKNQATLFVLYEVSMLVGEKIAFFLPFYVLLEEARIRGL